MIERVIDALFYAWLLNNWPWLLVAAGLIGLAYVLNRRHGAGGPCVQPEHIGGTRTEGAISL